MVVEDVDIAIVGGGPAGLAAAAALGGDGRRVVVLERDIEPGGVPRYSHHVGYGFADLHRLLSGPAYARHWAKAARRAGVEVRTETTVLDWTEERALLCTSPKGLTVVSARAVVLATGCRERPRAARLIAGTRPAGIFTTGSLQLHTHAGLHPIGTRAIVVGAEHVSFSAVLTLRGAGVRVVAMVDPLPDHQTYPILRAAVVGGRGVAVLSRHRIERVLGRHRVEAVEVRDLETDTTYRLACDTVVFSAGWVPNNELARAGGVLLDRRTQGPRVDLAFRTSRRGVFAVGNLLRGAVTADQAALEGRRVAPRVRTWLATDQWPSRRLEISTLPPFTWIEPSALSTDLAVTDASFGALDGDDVEPRFLLSIDRFVEDPVI